MEKTLQEIAESFIDDEQDEINKRFVWETCIESGCSEEETKQVWKIVEQICEKNNIEIVLDMGWHAIDYIEED